MMKRIVWIIIGILVTAMVVIQFFQSPKNLGAESTENDLFTTAGNMPREVRDMIKASCTDCHSDYTVYPWYGSIAPVSWMLASHIREGREHLNLSVWGTLSDRKKISALQEMGEVVTSGEMPLKGYARLHKNAHLTKDQKDQLLRWIDLETKRLMGE